MFFNQKTALLIGHAEYYDEDQDGLLADIRAIHIHLTLIHLLSQLHFTTDRHCMMNNITPDLIWFFLGLVLLLTELAIPIFVMVFFGIGAWMVLLLKILGLAPTLDLQLALFICVSVLTLMLFRKKAKIAHGRVLRRNHDIHEIDTLIGSTAVVIDEIEAGALGKVELFGTAWNATASEKIKKGSIVKIISHNNLTLTVKLP